MCRPLVLLALLGASSGCAEPAGGRAGALNLVLVVVDTTRADHLGYHAYARPTSPALDALAAESAAFLRHHSHASRTGPSVASILTGLHPPSHGVVNPLTSWDAKGTLGPDQTTLAEILAEHGYRTFGFTANPNVNPQLGFGQGYERYERLKPGTGDELNARAFEVLEDTAEPFFLYLHYMEPHSAYQVRPPNESLFADREYRGGISGTTRQLNEIVAGDLVPSDDDVRYLTALYDQEIRAFDDFLSDLLARLDERGLGERTLFALVSDHGEELLDHGSALHGYTLYDEQLRVPFLVRDPRVAPRRIDALSRHVDVLPTILELLELPVPRTIAAIQGRSLAPWIRGGPTPSTDAPVYAQASIRAVKTVVARSWTSGGWKLIQTQLPEPREELYHVAEDPGERHDLAAERPEDVRRLAAELEAFRAALPEADAPAVRLSESELNELRSLGYVR